MKRYLFALGFAFAAFTGCAVEPSAPPSGDETAQTADDSTAAESQAVEVPEALQPITNAFSCSSIHGSCLTPTLCRGNDGTQISGTGCAAGKICCGFNPCLNANPNNGCTSPQICAGNGSRQGLRGCATGQVCCRF